MTNLQLLKSYGEVKKKKYKNATIYYHASIEGPKRERDETLDELIERECYDDTEQMYIYDWWKFPRENDFKYSEDRHKVCIINWF